MCRNTLMNSQLKIILFMSNDKKKWNKTKTQKTWKKKITLMKVTSVKMEYLIRDKKVGEKWLNFLQVTKFFPDFLFPDQYFSPIFFHLTKNLSRFFLSRVIIIISHLFAKFIVTIFFILFFLMYFKHF